MAKSKEQTRDQSQEVADVREKAAQMARERRVERTRSFADAAVEPEPARSTDEAHIPSPEEQEARDEQTREQLQRQIDRLQAAMDQVGTENRGYARDEYSRDYRSAERAKTGDGYPHDGNGAGTEKD